jgi:hypothetical protein
MMTDDVKAGDVANADGDLWLDNVTMMTHGVALLSRIQFEAAAPYGWCLVRHLNNGMVEARRTHQDAHDAMIRARHMQAHMNDDKAPPDWVAFVNMKIKAFSGWSKEDLVAGGILAVIVVIFLTLFALLIFYRIPHIETRCETIGMRSKSMGSHGGWVCVDRNGALYEVP